jgi:DNA repair exonuclease SbcCD nuclease subunit
MKLAVFSDLHLTNQNPKFKTDADGVSDLIKDQLRFVEWMMETAIEEGCEGLLFLGDITDRSTLDPITQTYFNKVISRLVYGHMMDVILLEGNHCTADQLNRFSVLGAAKELTNAGVIHFVTQRESIEVGVAPNNIIFHVFPYNPDYKQIEAEIAELNDQLDTDLCNVLLFHFPCSNAQLDNGVPSPKGVHLSHDITSNFDLCLGGDFHRAQWLSGNPNAYYVGAPFALKFNEQPGEPRGFVIVDVDKTGRTVKRYPNPYDYTIRAVTPDEVDEVLDGNYMAPERVILQVKGQLDPVELHTLEEYGFYRFSNSKTGASETPDELLETVIELSDYDDEELLLEQLESVSEALRDRALELFARIQNDGE